MLYPFHIVKTLGQQEQKSMNKDVEEFKTIVADVWNNGLMGIDIGSIIVALAIFFAFLLIRGVFSKYVLNHLHKWAEKSTTKLDDKIVDALIPPIKFIPIILGIFFASQSMELSDAANDLILKLERSLIAFTIFWAIHRTLEPLSHGLKKLEKLLTKAMMAWIFTETKLIQ